LAIGSVFLGEIEHDMIESFMERLTSVFPEIEELEHIAVPRLHVDGECPLPLAAALINIPGRESGTAQDVGTEREYIRLGI